MRRACAALGRLAGVTGASGVAGGLARFGAMWAYATRDVRLAVRGACSVCGGGFHFEIDPPYLCTGFQIDPLRDRSTISETGYSTLFICIRLSIALCHQHLAFSGIMFAELVRCQEISANIRHLADHPLRQSCCDQDSS